MLIHFSFRSSSFHTTPEGPLTLRSGFSGTARAQRDGEAPMQGLPSVHARFRIQPFSC